MSFTETKPFNDNYDLYIVFGDDFAFTLLFDFNITNFDFEYFASETRGGAKVIDLDETDMIIVAGDPEVVQNSVTVNISSTITDAYDFDCLVHRFRWVDTSNRVKTVFAGKLQGVS